MLHTKAAIAAIAIQTIRFLGTISILKNTNTNSFYKNCKKSFHFFKKRNFNFLVINGKYKKDIFRTNTTKY
jgi:hypothetical protein